MRTVGGERRGVHEEDDGAAVLDDVEQLRPEAPVPWEIQDTECAALCARWHECVLVRRLGCLCFVQLATLHPIAKKEQHGRLACIAQAKQINGVTLKTPLLLPGSARAEQINSPRCSDQYGCSHAAQQSEIKLVFLFGIELGTPRRALPWLLIFLLANWNMDVC